MYLSAGDGIFAIVERVNGGAFVPHYIHKDHLGSIQTITDKDGKLEQRWAYDAWGVRSLITNSTGATGFLFDRGYTMHEHIDRYKLINMNGRVYDPVLGRFLSPDNFVQDAGSTQAYNRYTYCLNNPLAYTDPSGWISTETMPFQWIAPTYYYSSFFQPKFGAFAGDNYAVEYFSNFHNGGSHLAGAEVAGNFRSRGSGVINSILNSLYHWDKNSNSFRNGNNNEVSWNEVYTNYVVPKGEGYGLSWVGCGNYYVFKGYYLIKDKAPSKASRSEADQQYMNDHSKGIDWLFNHTNNDNNQFMFSSKTINKACDIMLFAATISIGWELGALKLANFAKGGWKSSLVSSFADLSAQMLTSTGSFYERLMKWNVTGSLCSGLFNNPFFGQATLGNALQINLYGIVEDRSELFKYTIFSDKMYSTFGVQTGIGGTFNFFGGEAIREMSWKYQYLPYLLLYTTGNVITNAVNP